MPTLFQDIDDFIRETREIAEHIRTNKIKSLKLLDNLSKEIYDDIVKVAAQLCGTKSAALVLISDEFAFVKSNKFPEVREYVKELTICNLAIQTPNDIMIIDDVSQDKRFAHIPQVVDGTVKFYLGVPMKVDNCAVGTLCVYDDTLMTLPSESISALEKLSELAVYLLVNHESK